MRPHAVPHRSSPLQLALTWTLVLFSLAVAGCPGPEMPLDTPSPGSDAPRVDVPGLDAPAPDAPGLDAPLDDVPGLDAPLDDVPGLDAPGLDAPGLDAPTTDSGSGMVIDPSAAGPFATTSDVTDTVTRGRRNIPVAAIVPTLPRGTTAPLVVFLPGFQLMSAQYRLTLERIASHGFLVVRADPPGTLFSVSHVEMAADAVAVIDWALAASELAGVIDPSRVALMGHSLGGKVSTMAASDARVTALLLLDPVNGGAGPAGYTMAAPDIVPERVAPLTIPIGIFGETIDGTGGFMPCAPTAQNYATFYDAATGAPWVAEYTLTGANHMQFLDDRASCGLTCSFCAVPTAADAAVIAIVRTVSVAFLRRHLLGETAMEPWLTGGSVPSGATVRRRP